MRYTSALLSRPGRTPQNEKNVPLKPNINVELRDFVTGKGSKSSNVACLQEMTILLACFKANEFDQVQCLKEISLFQKCFDEHLKAEKERQEMERKGLLAPGVKKLSHSQVTKLLRKFPNL